MKKCHQCDQQFVPEPEVALCPYCGFAEGISGLELVKDSQNQELLSNEDATTSHSKIRQYGLVALVLLMSWLLGMGFYLSTSIQNWWEMLVKAF